MSESELPALFAVLGHPHRIRIIEELRDGECDVKSLQHRLGISRCGVSQHLTVLRAHRIVCERLLGTMDFLEQESDVLELQEAIGKTRRAWAVK